MKMSSFITKTAWLLTVTLGMLMTVGCNSVIYDDEGDCSIHIKFRYDYNMKYADAFAHEVESVTLFVIDPSTERIIYQKSEEGEALKEEGYTMEVDLQPGTYEMIAWCGSKQKGSFTVPAASKKRELTCTLNTKKGTDGGPMQNEELDRLYYGYVKEMKVDYGHTYVMPLVKDTNNIRVMLQQTSGELATDENKFVFTLTEENSHMDWDNSLISPKPAVRYEPWYTTCGYTEMTTDLTPVKPTRAYFNHYIAEFTTARLLEDKNARLEVRKRTGEVVFSVPMIKLALLMKSESEQYIGPDGKRMGNQEFLDREDQYNFVFLLDENDRWVNSYIIINSYRVVLQNIQL